MNILTKDAFLAADDLVTEDVDLTEFGYGGSVRVRTLPATEMNWYQNEIFVTKKGELVDMVLQDAQLKLLTICIVGEDGEPLFTKDELDLLGKKSCKALGKLQEAAERLNGVKKKDYEELTGNSGATLGDES